MYYFFDLDGTVCESRQEISHEMKFFLEKLDNVIIISGAAREQMLYQLDGFKKCVIMAQSGNETPLWKNTLTEKEKKEINNHIKKVLLEEMVKTCYMITTDLIEDRGCQISLSLTGHKAPTLEKRNFDPHHKIRNSILKKYPFKSKTLQCNVAGTTCFDYIRKNGTKGKNITRWLKENHIDKKDCIYYGDALFKGGNDESVIGVIKTIKVRNPNHLLELLLRIT